MAQLGRYKYSVILNYVSKDNEEIQIESQSISYISTTYDYENLNMPIIIIVLNINSNLYNKIVINSETSTFMLSITKYDQDSSNPMKTDYIKAMFKYFLPKNPNYTKDLDSGDVTTGQEYKRVSIGLIKMDLVNYNKKIFNGIYKNTDILSLVHNGTSHIPIVIEPFTYNEHIDCLIIPPLSTVVSYLEFLNDYRSFYDKGYRYFMDFDRTYLLSTNGNAVDINDGSYLNINFNIESVVTDAANRPGILKDDDASSYIIYVDALDTDIIVNETTEKILNHITAITTEGTMIDKDIDVNKSSNNLRSIFKRIPNDNKYYADVIKNELENTSVVLNLKKTEIDSSVITPNKCFTVSNFEDYSSYNGKFILAYKKEIFKQLDGEFMNCVFIGLKKVI